MDNSGDQITQVPDELDAHFRPEQADIIDQVPVISPGVESATIPGLVRIITHSRAMERQITIADRPQVRCGQFLIDATQKSGFYQFMDVPILPDLFFNQRRPLPGALTVILHDNWDAIWAIANYGPLKF